MKKKIDIKTLIERYPFLRTGEPEWPLISLEIPTGWYQLFIQLCEDIRQPLLEAGKLHTFRFLQVKEKFNQLTCYSIGGIEEVNKILDKYAKMSRYVCSNCGRPATCETKLYILSFCDDCWKDLVRHQEIEWLDLNTSYQIMDAAPDREDYTRVISFEEEWKRYLAAIK